MLADNTDRTVWIKLKLRLGLQNEIVFQSWRERVREAWLGYNNKLIILKSPDCYSIAYSTGNERQTPTGGTISGQTYLDYTKNKHSADILSPRATPHKLFSSQL